MQTHEQLVSLRAYEIWERRGRPDGRDLECWLEAEREITAEEKIAGDEGVEGEGSYSAAQQYDRDVREFEKTGQVGKKAREAVQAVSGPESESLRKAEEIGRSHSRGEDPALKKR